MNAYYDWRLVGVLFSDISCDSKMYPTYHVKVEVYPTYHVKVKVYCTQFGALHGERGLLHGGAQPQLLQLSVAQTVRHGRGTRLRRGSTSQRERKISKRNDS